MKTFKTVLTAAVLSICLFVASTAMAAGLTAGQAQKFVESMQSVRALAEQMQKEGKLGLLRTEADFLDEGHFAPYSNGLKVLQRESPEDYAKLATVVTPYGFSSVEEWASTGDKVMIAYMAVKAQAAGTMNVRPAMPPEMMEKMHPEVRKQMERGLVMMEAIDNVPQEERLMVAPLVPQIDIITRGGQTLQ